MKLLKSIITFTLAISYMVSSMVCATAQTYGDFNGDGFQDVLTQANSSSQTTSLTPNSGSTVSNFHKSWLSNHPDIPEIDDWSEDSYSAHSANLNSNPGDELLLIGQQKIILLHGDIITPITIFPNVRNAIISWDATGKAIYSSFHSDTDLADHKIHFADFDGDGFNEIFFQSNSTSNSTSNSSYIVSGSGAIIQTMANGYLGVDWSTNSTFTFSDENGDGLFDMVITDASGNVSIVYAASNGTFTSQPVAFVPDYAKKFTSDVDDASLIEVTVDDQQAVGALEGQAGVSGGAASYSIPIALPPGRAGMQPNVSLNYSSRGGNGIAGVGWSLGVGSSVHRCGQTAATDSKGYGVTYSETEDRLCLDGKRLIVTSGIYGTSNAKYRTEIDSFVRVTQFGDINSSSSSFKVYHKNGRISHYGTSADARHNAHGRTENIKWAIKKVSDQSFNNMIYNYSEYGQGEHLLDSIDYTGYSSTAGNRHVEFSYDNERTDDSFSYLAGGKTEQTRLLNKITTKYQSTKVREYSLVYNSSNTSKRSILSTIQECAYDNGVDETCLPATNFSSFTPNLSWEPVDSGNANESPIDDIDTIDSDHQIRTKDLNGDGIAEILYLDRNVDEDNVNQFIFDIRVYELMGGVYIEDKNANLDGHEVKVYGGIEGDINGDGITDFIANEGGELVYYQFRKTSTTNFDLVKYSSGFIFATDYDRINTGQGVQLLDIDSDGYQDIVFTKLGINGTYNAAYYRNKANGQVDFDAEPITLHTMAKSSIEGSPSSNWNQSGSLMDLDGDGLVDLALAFPRLDSHQVSIAFAQRDIDGDISTTEYNAASLNLPLDHFVNQYLWADINGDGLKDFVRAVNSPTLGFDWTVQINLGNRTFANVQSLGTDVGIHSHRFKYWGGPNVGYFADKIQARFGAVQAADLDGDGAEELLVATHSDDDFSVRIFGEERDNNNNIINELAICVSNDDIHHYETTTFSCDAANATPGEEIDLGSPIDFDFSTYDFRRFYHSIIDFKMEDGKPTSAQITEDVVNAPINSTLFLDNTRLSALSLVDYNNDGYIDFDFSTSAGFRKPGADDPTLFGRWQWHTISGHRIAGTVGGSFVTGSDKPTTGYFHQANTLAHSSKLQDTVYKVEDGLGKKAEWDFAPISRSNLVNGGDLYSVPDERYIDGDPEGQHFYFTSSMPVVTNFRQSSGLVDSVNPTKEINETTYQYSEAVYNRMGRGFQGFRTIAVDSPAEFDATGNVTNHIRSVTDFHQIFPKAGKIESVRTCIKSNDATCASDVLSATDIVYGTKITANENESGNEKAHWVVPTSSITETFDPADYSTATSRKTNTIDIADTDNDGNVEKINASVFNGFSTVESSTVNVFTNTQYGLLNTSTVTVNSKANSHTSTVYDSSLDPSKTVKTTYTWTTENLPNVVTVEATVGGGKKVWTDTDYNSYGLPTKVTVSSSGESSRIVNTTYSKDGEAEAADGYFAYKTYNNLWGANKATIAQTYPEHGQVKQFTDQNGISTSTLYDVFGRVEQVTPTSGIGQPAFSRFALCSGGCDQISNSNIHYKVTTVSAGAPTTIVYKDKLNRALVSSTEGFSPVDGVSGPSIYQTVKYDRLGRKTFESVPSFVATEDKGTHFKSYDLLGRLKEKKVDQAQDETMQVNYKYLASGRTEIKTLPSSGDELTMYRTHSGTGQLMQTTDALEGVTQYAYDAMGNPIVLSDANGNPIKAEYNALGQKLYVIDPNMGRKDFTYTGFGEVDTETDAKAQTYNYNYDTLGRLTQRYLTTSAGTSLDAEFKFDAGSRGSNGVCLGLPHEELKGNGSNFKRNYAFDSNCRSNNVVTTIDNTPYQMKTQYDGVYGRVKAVSYPEGLTIKNTYNDSGYLKQSENAGSGYIYQKAMAMDARGQLTQAEKADGIIGETIGYDAVTGQMLNISAVSNIVANNSQRHKIDYNYHDGYGNLTSQYVENVRNGAYVSSTETYLYDDLHRLTQSDISVGNGATTVINYDYDAVGNFILKSDYVTSYSYGDKDKSLGGNAGPNAARTITKASGGTATYNYDLNGNMEVGDGKNISYNAFNKPVSVSRSGITSLFSYGSDQMRYKQVKQGKAGGEEVTHYIDKAYEVISHNGVVMKKSYLGDAIITETVGGSESGYKIGFVHRDRLGSVVTISDENGNLVDNKSYDPFGKPRKGTFETVEPATLKNIAWLEGFIPVADDSKLHTRRGFTDHEHMDDAELIHMNGRVYDYNLGRFLSVDPFIQAPGNSQSMNPYSYIMNNPLSGTDPSGYIAILDRCDAGDPICGGGNPYGKYGKQCARTCTSADNGKEDEPGTAVNSNQANSAAEIEIKNNPSASSQDRGEGRIGSDGKVAFYGKRITGSTNGESGPGFWENLNPFSDYNLQKTHAELKEKHGTPGGCESDGSCINKDYLPLYSQLAPTILVAGSPTQGVTNAAAALEREVAVMSAIRVGEFTVREQVIITEAQIILSSPEMATIVAAHKSGQSAMVNIIGRPIQYENAAFSGFTNFEGGGFAIGREAFKSSVELRKTVLHELYRLNTNTARTARSLGAGQSTLETNAAFNFAEKAVNAL